MACEQEIERAVASQGQQVLSAGATCRPTIPVCPSAPRKSSRSFARSSSAAARTPSTRTRWSASSTSSASRPATRSRRSSSSTARNSTFRRCRRAPSSTRACCSPIRSASITWTSAIRAMVSALAMVHQRFSTNTFPTWDLAHPFRLVCHNGEINTVRGNVNWIRARQQAISSSVLGDDLDKVWPLIYDGQSDSASFDNCLELLLMGGYPLAHAMMLMIPEAWAGNPLMDEDRRAFYEYHAALMEPWDGPAAMAFTDGRSHRRHARPQRVASGALHRHRRRLRDHGVRGRRARHPRAQDRPQVAPAARQDAAGRHRAGPHHRRRRIEAHARHREAVPRMDRPLAHRARCAARSRAAGALRRPAARPPAGVRLHAGRPEDHPRADGGERRGGDRLDGQRRRAAGAVQPAEGSLQLFQAAVRAGDQSADRSDPRGAGDVAGHLHRSAAEPARHRRDRSADAARGRQADPHRRRDGEDPRTSSSSPAARSARSSSTSAIRRRGAPRAWRPRWRAFARTPRTRSTWATTSSSSPIATHRADRMPIPALLATAAVHQHLVRKGLRTSTGLVVETGSAREVHQFALLAGYGAEAIHPYLALESLARAARVRSARSRRKNRPSASSRRSARDCTR